MRLIDADALLQDMETACNRSQFGRATAKMCVKRTPTIAAPVVRGEWEVAIGYDPNKKVQCQNCYKMAYEPTPYCPNCGADMRGSEVKE